MSERDDKIVREFLARGWTVERRENGALCFSKPAPVPFPERVPMSETTEKIYSIGAAVDWKSRGDCWGIDQYRTLLCPKCRFNYNHFGPAQVIPGNDAYEAPWDGRGDLLFIPIEGECGHLWELCVGFHKGNLAIFVRYIGEKQGEEIRS